jgi:hypothetical protein
VHIDRIQDLTERTYASALRKVSRSGSRGTSAISSWKGIARKESGG